MLVVLGTPLQWSWGLLGAGGELLLGPLLPKEEASLGNVTAGEDGPGQQGKGALNESSLKRVTGARALRMAPQGQCVSPGPEACSPGLTQTWASGTLLLPRPRTDMRLLGNTAK